MRMAHMRKLFVVSLLMLPCHAQAETPIQWGSNLNFTCGTPTITWSPDCVEPWTGKIGFKVDYWKPAYFIELANRPFDSAIPGMDMLGKLLAGVLPAGSVVTRSTENGAMMKEVHIWKIPNWLVMAVEPAQGIIQSLCEGMDSMKKTDVVAHNTSKLTAMVSGYKAQAAKLKEISGGLSGDSKITDINKAMKPIAAAMLLEPLYLSELDPVRWRFDLDGPDAKSLLSTAPGLCALTSLPTAAKDYLASKVPALKGLDKSCVGTWGALKPRSGHSLQASDVVHGAFVGYRALDNGAESGSVKPPPSTRDKMQVVWPTMSSQCFAPGTPPNPFNPIMSWEAFVKNPAEITDKLVYGHWIQKSCCIF